MDYGAKARDIDFVERIRERVYVSESDIRASFGVCGISEI